VRVKISDVARHAKVGAGTVSRVLNGSKNVSTRTRDRVRASIDALGYVPNLVARGLAANRTGIIAAVVPALGYSQHAEVVQGIAEFLHEYDITLMIGHSGYDLDVEQEVVSAFLARRPDAFYITGIEHSDATRRLLKDSGVPVVEGGNLTDTPIDCVVGYSNFEAMRQLTHRLHARGHRHIAHVNIGPR
jgi:LacI family gluconate utilization system Gnt-I transcriptional repressor